MPLMLSSTTTTVTGLLRRRREKRRSSARRTRREFLKATGLLVLSAGGETWAASAEELGRPSSAASHDDSQARPALFPPKRNGFGTTAIDGLITTTSRPGERSR